MVTAAGGHGIDDIEVFEYPASPGILPLPAWNGWMDAADESAASAEPNRGGMRNPADGTLDQSLAQEVQRSFESGRERGRQEGRYAEREAQAVLLAAAEGRQKQQLAVLVARFSEESERYLHAVEQEVVKLALAIASRILRREAQMDPLLLTGAVRVALGQLAASSEVRLRVPKAEVDLWTETIASAPNLALRPVVVAGEGMRVGDCVIESKTGTVDLGARAQLAEIERGFFDGAGGGHADAIANSAVQGVATDEAQS